MAYYDHNVARRRNLEIALNKKGTTSYFDLKRPAIDFPNELQKQGRFVVGGSSKFQRDPYKHLGLIGYKKNTYYFGGEHADLLNSLGWQHMKKTLWLEEMRRRVIAEEQGINETVDETTLGAKAEAYHSLPESAKGVNRYHEEALRPKKDERPVNT